jgi:hypothetical protein
MDLRGFSRANQGCLFEIGELLNVVPLDRVVFVVDASTDEAFLREALARSWSTIAASSPNRDLAAPSVGLFRFSGRGEGGVASLVATVVAAANGTHRDPVAADHIAPAMT